MYKTTMRERTGAIYGLVPSVWLNASKDQSVAPVRKGYDLARVLRNVRYSTRQRLDFLEARKSCSREKASYLASLAGLAGIVGKLITGMLTDRFNAGWVSGVTSSALSIAYIMLIEPFSSPALVIVAMIIIGYSAGCVLQICAYLTSQYAGMRNFGKVFGVMASMLALGVGFGPLIAGAVYDSAGSYEPMLIVSIFISLVGGALLIGLGSYPDWGRLSRYDGPSKKGG